MQELNKETAERLKEIELDLLRVFIHSCDKLGLKYYIIGGTLLGAVRHHGFIPWDDDIDVAMMRDDYEKWIKEAPRLLDKNKYFVQTFLSDSFYPANFAKLRNNQTTFIETSMRKLNINHGVYIDVFPLDYYPESKQTIFRFNQLRYTSKIMSAFDLDAVSYSNKKRLVRRLLAFTVFGDSFYAVKKREQLYRSINKGRLIANHSGAWGKKEIVPAEWYGNGTKLVFEGIDVLAPIEYHKWLTQVYGDYMELPPIEKRVTHHFTEIIDLDKPYKEYLKK